MRTIAFAGTFDTFTKGHEWVVRTGLSMAEQVLILVANNPSKSTWFSTDEIIRSIEQIFTHEISQGKVTIYALRKEYTAISAKELGADFMIRGIRSAVDFDYERLIQRTNHEVLQGANTFFVAPPPDLENVSSSFVKSLIGPVGWMYRLDAFVSKPTLTLLVTRYLTEQFNRFIPNPTVDELKFFQSVLAAYGDSSRHYHDLCHLAFMLSVLDNLLAHKHIVMSNSELKELFLAILGHDICMVPTEQAKAEEISAQLTDTYVKSPTVFELILSTCYLSEKHSETKYATPLQKEVLNYLDLAILGQPSEIYQCYKENTRKEYSQYTDEEYRFGRVQALRKLITYLEGYSFSFSGTRTTLAQTFKNLNAELSELT